MQRSVYLRLVTAEARCRQRMPQLHDCAGAVTVCYRHQLQESRPSRSLPSAHREGPFGVSYDRLADHMGSVGLCCELNLWDNPLTVISKGPHSSSYVLEQPEQFQPWLVPFGSNGHAPLATPNDLACPLPPAFTQAVEDRIAFVKYFRSKLQGIDDVDEDLRRAFTANIESRFTDWLNESGHDRQLQDLLTMDHHPASGEMASQQRHGSRPGSASPGTRRHRMPAQVAAVSASAGVDV
eukprot:m.47138 g.47138  ORF g.47138 m.47138 type:complete len:238 (+) comp11904_c0_seq1:1066-1779(+)